MLKNNDYPEIYATISETNGLGYKEINVYIDNILYETKQASNSEQWHFINGFISGESQERLRKIDETRIVVLHKDKVLNELKANIKGLKAIRDKQTKIRLVNFYDHIIRDHEALYERITNMY